MGFKHSFAIVGSTEVSTTNKKCGLFKLQWHMAMTATVAKVTTHDYKLKKIFAMALYVFVAFVNI